MTKYTTPAPSLTLLGHLFDVLDLELFTEKRYDINIVSVSHGSLTIEWLVELRKTPGNCDLMGRP